MFWVTTLKDQGRDLSRSHDVIGHVTIWLAVCGFL